MSDEGCSVCGADYGHVPGCSEPAWAVERWRDGRWDTLGWYPHDAAGESAARAYSADCLAFDATNRLRVRDTSATAAAATRAGGG